MGIRREAAEKLVKQLLELRLNRVIPLSDRFLETMAKIVMAHVDMDEQRQRSEEFMKDDPPTAAERTPSEEKP